MGFFENGYIVGSNVLTGGVNRNAFIVKLDSNGAVQWVRNLSDGTTSYSVSAGSQYFSVTVDERTGDAYVTGTFSYPVTVGTYSFNPNGNRNSLIVKYTAAGSVAWAVQFSNTYNQAQSGALGVGMGNELWVTGLFSGSMYAGNFTLPGSPQGSDEVYVARLCASTGAVLYVQKFPTSPSSYTYAQSNGVTVNRLTGRPYVVGAIYGSMTVGSQTISTSGFDSWITSLGGMPWTTSLDVCIREDR